MKILIAHNFYQRPGGEDTIFQNEIDLLTQNGHEAIVYSDHNDRVNNQGKLRTVLETFWSHRSYKQISTLLTNEKPDIAYFFNTFPLISPSVYYACKRQNVPVIQVLANPRYMCPKATLHRNEKVCLDCVGKFFAWPGILHSCYHDSRLETAIVALMLAFHKLIRTWLTKVDAYFVATNFYIDLYQRAGLPSEKLFFKPHHVKVSDVENDDRGERYALYLGRLDPEKGVRILLKAWKNLNIPLKIRGDGLLQNEVIEFINNTRSDSVELIGRLNEKELLKLIQGASFLVWPSQGYYETFGMVAVESYSQGVPVLGSNIGVMQEIVINGFTGILFEPESSDDLAIKARWMWEHPTEVKKMGENVSREIYP